MSEYDISVIVPIYNAEKHLDQCIQSILAQTKDRLQLVLVNDGSTDKSSDIIERYAKRYDFITVINQENKGLAGARAAGLKAACGLYIGWVDADDFLEPSMYQRLFDLAEREKADYVYCDYDFYPRKVSTKEKWFKPYNGVIDWHYIDRNTQCWNTLASRTLLDEIDLANLYPRFEEYSWISVMLRSKKTISIDDKLYHYRVGDITMSGGSYKGKLAHFWQGANISEHLSDIAVGSGYETSLADYFQYRYIYTLIQVQIVAALNDSSHDYKMASEKLYSLKFRKNHLTKQILDENHGALKSFVMRWVIQIGYPLTKMITKAFL